VRESRKADLPRRESPLQSAISNLQSAILPMILVFGYRTPSVLEIPVLLYLGADGDEANKICETDPHPRIEKVVNPTLHSIKHWDETASVAFEKKQGKSLDEPVVGNVHPHLEPGANVDGSAARASAIVEFVRVPEFKELIARGYSKEAAQVIGFRQQAMFDAYAKDPALSEADLEKIAGAVAPAPPLPPPVVLPPPGKEEKQPASESPSDDLDAY
jgi:hypothetical protein